MNEENLIINALEKTKQARNTLIGVGNVLNKPTLPKAFYSYLYLTLREAINVGCSETVKTILNPYKKPQAYGVLKKAVQEIFFYGKNPQIINLYAQLLNELQVLT